MWLVIVSEKPFTVWLFSDYHLRFFVNSQPCDSQKEDTKNQGMGVGEGALANLGGQINSSDIFSKEEYLNYLKSSLKLSEEKIKDQDKQIARISRMCVQSNVEKLKLMRNTVIVLGLDLMVDELFNLWLLQVNSSPLSESTTVG